MRTATSKRSDELSVAGRSGKHLFPIRHPLHGVDNPASLVFQQSYCVQAIRTPDYRVSADDDRGQPRWPGVHPARGIPMAIAAAAFAVPSRFFHSIRRIPARTGNT